ncbi:3-oxoacyl-[acyl-carrier-protein] reductase FabG-like [Sitodiplosis mosellana]|uniref:3-oxoacyl-[acyl-carrier-protein] reductase FabG-like n=1 Tax=Sitodiplosis mosellana TaxID=263140 RepID=UPI002443D17C|nr:3-oxoacyl-[acyl-carrier-protein] reductase FabG-like [Sitodiplosis mosellana]
MSFENQVVLITGASAGIGSACVEYFAKQGALLALVGRNEKKFGKIVRKIKGYGITNEPLVIIADVSVDSERIISETIEQYGRLNILINNAGFSIPGSIETLKMDDYDAMMATNVRAVVELTQQAIVHLVETKGNIVNVSSVAGITSNPNILAYSMSKAALDQFTKCAAMELAPKEVRVNAVVPSFIDTDFYAGHGLERGGDEYSALVEANINAHPLERIGYTKDCVNAIAFLAKDSSNFITAVLLPVDGGISSKGAF